MPDIMASGPCLLFPDRRDLRFMRFGGLNSLLCAALLSVSLQSFADGELNVGGIVGKAEVITYKANDNVLFLENRAIATKGVSKIRADKITVYLDSEGNAEKAVATGSPAYFSSVHSKSKEPINGEAESIEYLINESVIKLESKAIVKTPKHTLTGDKVIYELGE